MLKIFSTPLLGLFLFVKVLQKRILMTWNSKGKITKVS